MPDQIAPGSLGTWSMIEYTEAALVGVGIGTDAGLPAEVRFLANTVKLIRRRIAEAAAQPEKKGVAVFLLAPNVPDEIEEDAVRVPRLENGLTSLVEKLWFVNEIAASGRSMNIGDKDDEAVFELVCNELSLGAVPAIFYDSRTASPEVVYYPSGLSELDTRSLISLNSEVTLEQVLKTVETIYEKMLVTPDAQSQELKLWENPGKFWPIKNAERGIQAYLRMGLQGAFPACIIREEQSQTTGRIDLEVEGQDAINRSSFTRYALLELKVLRSFGSTGDVVTQDYTMNWIESGVKQASSYRDERGARESALCCFDMRTSKSSDECCFEHVRDLAQDRSVVTRLWYLFASSELYREYLNQTA
ncbi:MAG: hypothetical protein GC165_16550 [Armatimonadetes bacterium]|nr:hypothetical protein [Armatimonadota bacterium]